ncbi:hypothetical protein PFISCL1PPCAC_438, partial [Pristionchus fissidentatus]
IILTLVNLNESGRDCCSVNIRRDNFVLSGDGNDKASDASVAGWVEVLHSSRSIDVLEAVDEPLESAKRVGVHFDVQHGLTAGLKREIGNLVEESWCLVDHDETRSGRVFLLTSESRGLTPLLVLGRITDVDISVTGRHSGGVSRRAFVHTAFWRVHRQRGDVET